jgi:hypothetical protein
VIDRMMARMAVWSLVWVAALVAATQAAPAPWPTREFSAVVVRVDPGRPATEVARAYVGRSRMRVEDTKAQRTYLYDRGQNVTWILVGPERKYIQVPRAMGPVRLFLPVRQTEICPQLREVHCRPVGTERVAGRTAERWRIQWTVGGRVVEQSVWWDPELGIRLRTRDAAGSVLEVRSLRLGPQPPSLFQIPGDYRRGP